MLHFAVPGMYWSFFRPTEPIFTLSQAVQSGTGLQKNAC